MLACPAEDYYLHDDLGGGNNLFPCKLHYLNVHIIIPFLQSNYSHLFKIPVPLKRRFFRKQAGLSNRWQLPFSFNCDLLGIAQAKKASRVGLNETLMRIMSGKVMRALPKGRHLYWSNVQDSRVKFEIWHISNKKGAIM